MAAENEKEKLVPGDTAVCFFAMHIMLTALSALLLALNCQAGSLASTSVDWNLRNLTNDAIAGESFTVSFCLPDP